MSTYGTFVVFYCEIPHLNYYNDNYNVSVSIQYSGFEMILI